MVIATQRRRVQIIVKPVKVCIDARLKTNGLHAIAKSLGNLGKLILAEIRILQDIAILKIVINGERRMMASQPRKRSIGFFICIRYRTSIGVVVDTVRNPETFAFGSVSLKR